MHRDATIRPLAVALAALLLAGVPTAAQQPSPDAAPAQPSSGLPTPPEVVGAIGRFIGQSIDAVGTGKRSAGEAPAEAGTTPDAQPAAPSPAQTQRAPSSGIPTPPEVVGAIGRIIGQSIDTVGAGIKGAGETLGEAGGAAGDLAKGVKDAAGSVARLPLSSVVSGSERCAVAPNGGADCAAASVALCQSKGFARGSALDITSTRKCPVSAWLHGTSRSDAACSNELFVARAACQP